MDPEHLLLVLAQSICVGYELDLNIVADSLRITNNPNPLFQLIGGIRQQLPILQKLLFRTLLLFLNVGWCYVQPSSHKHLLVLLLRVLFLLPCNLSSELVVLAFVLHYLRAGRCTF